MRSIWFWRAALLLALAGLFASPLFAQLSRQLKARGGFKYREPFEPTGAKQDVTIRTRSYVFGAEGTYLSNNLVLLTTAGLENYASEGNVTNLVATAPECLLDLSNRTASSTGRLELIGLQRRLFVRGNEGFVLFLTNSTLVVSNHVRTYIHPELLKSAAP